MKLYSCHWVASGRRMPGAKHTLLTKQTHNLTTLRCVYRRNSVLFMEARDALRTERRMTQIQAEVKTTGLLTDMFQPVQAKFRLPGLRTTTSSHNKSKQLQSQWSAKRCILEKTKPGCGCSDVKRSSCLAIGQETSTVNPSALPFPFQVTQGASSPYKLELQKRSYPSIPEGN